MTMSEDIDIKNFAPLTHAHQYELLRTSIFLHDIVYITGLHSVGKLELIRNILKFERSVQNLHTIIDCYQVATPSKLYSTILNSLAIQTFGKENPQMNLTASEFLRNLRCYQEDFLENGYEKIFIIFKHVDLFKKTALIDTIVLIASIARIGLVLISRESPQIFLSYFKQDRSRSLIADRMNVIVIPPFDAKETIDLIVEEKPTKKEGLYFKFVNNVVSVAYNSQTKNFIELKTLCQKNFLLFLKDYEEEIDKFTKKRENIDSDGKDFLLEDHVVPSTHIVSLINSCLRSWKASFYQSEFFGDNLIDTQVCFGKSILIFAAYIAANTTPAADKINFVKLQKKKLSKSKQSNEVSPKEFTLERLLQIYNGLCDLSRGRAESEKTDPLEFSDSVLGDVQRLEDLDIIHLTSGDGKDSLSRYRISGQVPQIFFERVARQVDLPLEHMYGLPYTTETRTYLMNKY